MIFGGQRILDTHFIYEIMDAGIVEGSTPTFFEIFLGAAFVFSVNGEAENSLWIRTSN
jgi:hypothetical protein